MGANTSCPCNGDSNVYFPPEEGDEGDAIIVARKVPNSPDGSTTLNTAEATNLEKPGVGGTPTITKGKSRKWAAQPKDPVDFSTASTQVGAPWNSGCRKSTESKIERPFFLVRAAERQPLSLRPTTVFPVVVEVADLLASRVHLVQHARLRANFRGARGLAGDSARESPRNIARRSVHTTGKKVAKGCNRQLVICDAPHFVHALNRARKTTGSFAQ